MTAFAQQQSWVVAREPKAPKAENIYSSSLRRKSADTSAGLMPQRQEFVFLFTTEPPVPKLCMAQNRSSKKNIKPLL